MLLMSFQMRFEIVFADGFVWAVRTLMTFLARMNSKIINYESLIYNFEVHSKSISNRTVNIFLIIKHTETNKFNYEKLNYWMWI